MELEAPFEVVPLSPKKSTQKSEKLFYLTQFILRTLVIGFTLAGAITTVTSKQTVIVFSIPMEARYDYASALKFKFIADSLVCGLSLLSVIHVISIKSNPKNYFYLHLHDLVSLLVLVSACSAAMAIGFVAEFGQEKMGWVKMCDKVGKFCDRTALAIALSFAAVGCLFLLTVLSAFKLKA